MLIYDCRDMNYKQQQYAVRMADMIYYYKETKIIIPDCNSRVPDERFLRICLNVITHTCMIHRWNEENKQHRNKDVVAMYCGHVFFKLGSKVKI